MITSVTNILIAVSYGTFQASEEQIQILEVVTIAQISILYGCSDTCPPYAKNCIKKSVVVTELWPF